MKLVNVLTVADKKYQLSEGQVIIELNAAGRATFTVIDKGVSFKRFDLVTFSLNYSHFESLQRFFIGFVDTATRVDNQQTKLFCRELSSALSYPMPISLRHASLDDVLTAISDKTQGITFTLPDSDYSQVKIPHFANIGSGYNALNLFGRLFKIPDYIWQQQDDGSIYVGSWEDGGFAQIDLNNDLFFDVIANQSASIVALPTLRPGQVINGQRVRQIELMGNTMTLSFK